jgi:hypothetical protein
MRSPAILALIFGGCVGGVPQRTRTEQLAQCRAVSGSGEALTRCLAIDRNWTADSASMAGAMYQHEIDSAAAAVEYDLTHYTENRLRIDGAYNACTDSADAVKRSDSTRYAPFKERCDRAWYEAKRQHHFADSIMPRD